MTAGAVAAAPEEAVARSRLPQRALLAVALLSPAVALALYILDPRLDSTVVWGFRGYPALFAVTFSLVGYLVASRRPRNPVGWLLLCVGVLSGLQVLSSEYGLYDALGPSRLPAGPFVAWVAGWIWTVSVGLVVGPTLALFPDGRPLSSRWRPLVWSFIPLTAAAAAAFAFTPERLINTGLPNPLAVPLEPSVRTVTAAIPLYAAFVVGAGTAASLFLRYRRAYADERQQIKWLAAAGAVFALSLGMAIPEQGAAKWTQFLIISAILLIPISIGVAVLRYRLYEIDAIINRALVYGALTAILAGVFAASTEILKRTFVEVAGGSSDLAVVIAIFLVVTVFEPLHGGVKRLVDRRFQSARPAPVPTLGASVTQTLRELADLRDRGVLTDAELEAKKRELLARL